MKNLLLTLSLLSIVSFANAQLVENNQNFENKEFQSYKVGSLNIRNYSGNYLIKASNNLILGTSFAAASVLSAALISSKKIAYTEVNGEKKEVKGAYAVSYVLGGASLCFYIAFPINLKKAGKAMNFENNR